MKRYPFWLLLCILTFTNPITGHAKDKVVTAEYLFQIPDNMSQNDAKNKALERARQQAIADEFGIFVTQESFTSVQNSEEGGTTDFFSTGGSEARGEWIQTIGEPEFEYFTSGENVAIRVKVKGRIREIERAELPIEIKILRNGIEDINESDIFGKGDDMYMSFKSTLNGYIAVYLIDNKNNAYCLLPYSSQKTGFFQTQSNKRYVFFHPDLCIGIDRDMVDSLVMDTEDDREHDRILVIFSPNKFYKAVDEQSNIDFPRELGIEEFKKWLGGMRKRDKEMTVCIKPITIVKQ